MRLDKVKHIREHLVNEIELIVRKAIRLRLNQEEFNRLTGLALFSNPDYQSLPRWAKEYIDGYLDGCERLIWERLVYAYFIHETWVTIESKTFQDMPTDEIYYSATKSAYVWRDDTNKPFTGAYDRKVARCTR